MRLEEGKRDSSPGPLPAIVPTIQHRIDDVFALWGELSSFGMHESDQALRLCLERLGEWLDAQNAFWVGTVRILNGHEGRGQPDILSGWRIRALQPLRPQFHDLPFVRKLIKTIIIHSKMDPGAAMIALAAGAGQFRAHSLLGGELLDMDVFRQTEHYDRFYRQRGVCDRIWVAFPVNADTESIFCFDRMGDVRPFDGEDLALASFALRGIRWFHRQILLSRGLGLCTEPLTAAERRVIQGLLTGVSEREIGYDLNLSPGTVHQYATRVYRKFGVRGRTEFTALWLGGGF